MKKLLLSIFWLLMVLKPSFSSADLTWYSYSFSFWPILNNPIYLSQYAWISSFSAWTCRNFTSMSLNLWTNQSVTSNYINCIYISSNYNIDWIKLYRSSNTSSSPSWLNDVEDLWFFPVWLSKDYLYCYLPRSDYVSYYMVCNESNNSVNFPWTTNGLRNISYISFEKNFFQSLISDNCLSCPSCPNQYTSLECQTEYNLIPIENVTENYCTSNFNLISPSDCPVSWWTWDINWSSVWINNQQVVWSPNIFLNIYDKLDWSQTYVNQDMYIDVNGPEGDEEYINWIIGINTYRPTSEDFTTVFVSGLTLLFPYIVITLFVLFIRKLIRKIFK